MRVIKTEDMRVPLKVWDDKVEIEPQSLQQMMNVCMMPFVEKWAALMPDGHLGIGGCVGAVVPTYKAIIPALVGKDVGCGMNWQGLNIHANDLPDNLHAVYEALKKAIPNGRTEHGGKWDTGAWHDPLPQSWNIWELHLREGFEKITAKYPKFLKSNHINHLCSLGTGNHFIELCFDENQMVSILLHSGSRGIGNSLGSFFIELAKEDMQKFFINLPDKDLAYLPEGTEHFDDYVHAVHWAQEFAKWNRFLMMNRVIETLQPFFGFTLMPREKGISCHHNYVQKENHFGKNIFVTRKGAVSARVGQFGIIPGSMGKQSFIVEGKGNSESFTSCSHGAGRRMSRTEARRTFTVSDHERETEGVVCDKSEAVLDETPQAYKDINAVMESQNDLVTIKHVLKQFLNVKGESEGKY